MDAQKRLRLLLEDRGCIVHNMGRPASSRFRSKSPVDLFGIIDLVALTPRDGLFFFQACTEAGATAHRRKIEAFFDDARAKGISLGSTCELASKLVLSIWRKKGWFAHQQLSTAHFLEDPPMFHWEAFHHSHLE